MEIASLQFLKQVLFDFSEISGLKCNTEKTSLMPIGPVAQVPEEITDLGFQISERIHILGMDIVRSTRLYSSVPLLETGTPKLFGGTQNE